MSRSSSVATLFLLWGMFGPPPSIGQESKPDGPAQRQAAEPDLPRTEKTIFDACERLNDLKVTSAGSFLIEGSPAKRSEVPKDGNPRPDPAPAPLVLTPNPTKTIFKRFDPLETNFGVGLAEADATLRAQLELPKGEGIVVILVKAGSPADHAGLKANDVLLSLGDRKAKEVPEIRKALLELNKEPLDAQLIREGKPLRLSLVGPEKGFAAETDDYWIGVPISPVDATLRSHLPSLPPETGLVANDVVKGSPADKASVRKDDILMSLDGKPLKTAESLIEQVKASQGKPVPLKLFRASKELTLTITPARREPPRITNFTGYDMLTLSPQDGQVRYRVVQPNLAIEIDPSTSEVKIAASGSPEAKLPLKHALTGRSFLVDPNRSSVQHAPSTVFFKEGTADPSTDARIEGRLKEMTAKLDAMTKALEGLRKAVEK